MSRREMQRNMKQAKMKFLGQQIILTLKVYVKYRSEIEQDGDVGLSIALTRSVFV
jgi:hypothetical protein